MNIRWVRTNASLLYLDDKHVASVYFNHQDFGVDGASTLPKYSIKYKIDGVVNYDLGPYTRSKAKEIALQKCLNYV